jgi:uncharacterized surface protein with fasciclin (FAS1) repeats
MSEKLDLIETIAGQDNFSTFSRIMKSSGANDVIAGDGSFTVLAPTNDAFNKIPDKTLDALLKDQKQLKALLSYHILPGKVMAASLRSTKAVTGQEVVVTDINGIKINSSALQARNLEASNGVVHGIDKVLAPSTHYGAPKPLG